MERKAIWENPRRVYILSMKAIDRMRETINIETIFHTFYTTTIIKIAVRGFGVLGFWVVKEVVVGKDSFG